MPNLTPRVERKIAERVARIRAEAGGRCRHCGAAVADLEAAVRHHDAEHADEAFHPLWYSDPEDWRELNNAAYDRVLAKHRRRDHELIDPNDYIVDDS